MTVKQLKEFIEGLDDDYKIIIRTMTKRDEKEMIESKYPFPYNMENHDNIEFHDVGVSDRVIIFGIEIEK